jgi:hypothetical protein
VTFRQTLPLSFEPSFHRDGSSFSHSLHHRKSIQLQLLRKSSAGELRTCLESLAGCFASHCFPVSKSTPRTVLPFKSPSFHSRSFLLVSMSPSRAIFSKIPRNRQFRPPVLSHPRSSGSSLSSVRSLIYSELCDFLQIVITVPNETAVGASLLIGHHDMYVRQKFVLSLTSHGDSLVPVRYGTRSVKNKSLGQARQMLLRTENLEEIPEERNEMTHGPWIIQWDGSVNTSGIKVLSTRSRLERRKGRRRIGAIGSQFKKYRASQTVIACTGTKGFVPAIESFGVLLIRNARDY